VTFASPLFLLLLAVPAWLAWAAARRPQPGFVFPMHSIATLVRPSLRRRVAVLASYLPALASALVVIGLARPQADHRTVESTSDGIDIQLVLDVSSSMNDTEPFGRSRLEVARSVIDAFVAGRGQDRVGLLTFARYPRMVCPLTLDHGAVRAALGRVRAVHDEREDSTAIGVALASAVLRLRDSDARTRIVVLLTDGSNNVLDIEVAEAARLAGNHGIHVYTIAAGSRAKADELAEAARLTGGRGFRARDARMLVEIYATIDQLETHEIVETSFVSRVDVYPRFLLAALAVLAFELALTGAWLRRSP